MRLFAALAFLLLYHEQTSYRWVSGPRRGSHESLYYKRDVKAIATSLRANDGGDIMSALPEGGTITPASSDSRAEIPRDTLDAVNPNADTEYQEYDVIPETALNAAIEDAVQRIIDDALKGSSDLVEPEKSPVEKFQQMYREIKATKRERKDGTVAKMDSAVMLENLLGGEQTKDPFDERKVMMKLRSMLNQEDFKDLFLDPKIGDIL